MSKVNKGASDGPVLIDLEQSIPVATPSEVAPVPEARPQAMQIIAQIAAKPPSRLARWFWSLLGALLVFMLSVAAWDFVMGMLARNPVLGGIASILAGLFVLVLLILAIREWRGFTRLKRLDHLQRSAKIAQNRGDLDGAKRVTDQVLALYEGRDDVQWGRRNFNERKADVFDADGLLGLAEAELMTPLDGAAIKEIEAAARSVAATTALVPLALADVVVALTVNLRMIRRIAEIYGGRSGWLGNWRLTRSVLTHLVATGAVSVGDDLIHSVAGGGVLSKISRRFGEGIINGALTARVGGAALEVCRPLPFVATPRPSVTMLVQKALTGLFSRS